MASSIFRSVLNRSRASAGVLSSNVLTDIGVTLFQKQPAFMTKRTLSSNVPENLWKLGRLNHVAIATPNLSKSVTLYKDVMGASVSDPEDLEEHGVTVVFVNLDNTKIELLYPLGDNSPIKGFLDKNANGGIHHICIEVNNIEEAVKDVKAKKIRCLSPEPRIGAHGKPVMFLHPKDCAGVLIELEQA